jgi:lysophospholipase L1-like esterase
MVAEENRKKIPIRRRVLYVALIYLTFLLVLIGIEVLVRVTMSPVSSLDLFVGTPQQRAQVAGSQSTIFEGDPLLLWRLKPNLKNVVWDFTVLSTNGQSFRSDRPVGGKEPGVFRIVCLGDSVTFGYRVPVVWPDKPTEYDPSWLPYPMLLENQLRSANPGQKVEVINMAVPGYTSHQGLVWLQESIDQLQPDLLTASFGWNDVSFSDVADREAIQTGWYRVSTRWLIDHSQAFAHITRWLRSGKKQSGTPRPKPRVSQVEYLSNMSQIVGLAGKRGIRTVIIAAPYRDNVTNTAEAALMTSYRNQLKSWAEQERVPFLEIRELTEAAHPTNEGWFGELIHPNHMGHRLITSELLKLLDRDGLLPNLKVPALTP